MTRVSSSVSLQNAMFVLGNGLIDDHSIPLKKSGQAKRFDKMIVVRISHNSAKAQRDWDIYGQLPTYACKGQVYGSTYLTLSESFLSQNSLHSTAFNVPTVVPTEVMANKSPHVPQAQLLHGIARRRKEGDKWMKMGQRHH